MHKDLHNEQDFRVCDKRIRQETSLFRHRYRVLGLETDHVGNTT